MELATKNDESMVHSQGGYLSEIFYLEIAKDTFKSANEYVRRNI